MNTKTKKLSTVSMVLCGMFAALVAIGAFIQIPVPYMDYFTLQFFMYYWDLSEYRSLQQAEESDTYSGQVLVIWSDSL